MRSLEGAALAADLTRRAAGLLEQIELIAAATVNQSAVLREKLSARDWRRSIRTRTSSRSSMR